MSDKWEDYQVVKGEFPNHPIKDWIVSGINAEDALCYALKEQEKNGGRGAIDVVGPITPICPRCGLRHRPPPSPLNPDSYCRD